jgi:hypothetical protein
MEDRQWMYTRWRSSGDYNAEWVKGTDLFLKQAFGPGAGGHSLVWCPYRKCDNMRKVDEQTMGRHLVLNGYTPNYYQWIYHGEADRMKSEVVRPRLEAFDDDAGVADMLDDTHQAHFAEEREKEMEESAKAFFKMLESAQKPIHEHTTVSQLDVIGRVMGLKAELNLSREDFDKMVAMWGSMLPKRHSMPNNLYESEKVLRMLKMSYDKIHVCPKGCVLFRKEHKDANYYLKCKSSRYLEVDSGDGQKKQLPITARMLWHLPFLPRLQRLFMSEESVKQMTWDKDGKWYNPGKMVHPSNAEAWTYFNDQHPDKAAKARNVRVALATDGFNPYRMMAAPYICCPVFVIPLNLPPGISF